MVPNNTKVKLDIDEPWELSQTVFGFVFQTFRSKEGKNYLLIMNQNSSKKYVLTNRYSGDDVSMVSKATMIVAIAITKEEFFSFKLPNFMNYLTYYAIGSIQSIDDYPQVNSNG